MEYIDVLQCHRFDDNTPIEETMQALHDVVKAGYVRYLGMSSCHAWQLHMMQSEQFNMPFGRNSDQNPDYAINNRLTPFISMQNYHSLLYREEEREMLPVCKASIASFISFITTYASSSLVWAQSRGRLYPAASSHALVTHVMRLYVAGQTNSQKSCSREMTRIM